jgi:hypothetical protein
MTKKRTITKTIKSTRRQKPGPPTQIHELRITLHGSKPTIWRRIAVPSDILLSDLHEVMQIVMGWSGCHLHQFVIRNTRPRLTRAELNALVQSSRLDKLAMYMRRDRCFSDPQFELEEAEDESKIMLNELAPAVKSKFIYEYDFGDGWDHDIQVVKIGPPAEGVKYIVCISGKLACPPEDCGGIWGYYEMLEALENPRHERHEEFTEWLPRGFDPERFDLNNINDVLAKLQ